LIFIKVTDEGPCLTANERNFFKVELWTKDDQRVERLLHAGEARAVFAAASIGRAGAAPPGSGAVCSSIGPPYGSNLTNQNVGNTVAERPQGPRVCAKIARVSSGPSGAVRRNQRERTVAETPCF
jgi:hypothetical protein